LKALEGPAWIIIGVAICLYAYKMGLGSFHEPGAGFVAFVTGLFLMLMGALIVMGRKTDLRRIPKDEKREVRNSETSFFLRPVFKLAYAVALLLVYALFLDRLGYVLATFLVMFGLFYDPGRRRLGLAFTASLLSTGMTYLVFEMWLHTQLPRGVFPWW
jgi:Tripartite tricarboxylate transporter TctB family